MTWIWILKRFANASQGTRLWGYLASRDQNKSRIQLEKARAEGTKDLIHHLPYGAILREGTAESWREILMPDALQPPLLVLPAEHTEPEAQSPELTGLPQLPIAPSRGDESDPSDG